MTTKNEFGFYELSNKPSQAELDEYYSKKYYQEATTHSYSKQYSDAETQYYLQKNEQKHQNLVRLGALQAEKTYRLLDVGCGEGFTLEYFRRIGWDITGLDYSKESCSQFNPQCAESVIAGDVHYNLHELFKRNIQYDVIWLDNVLEHVLQPLELLQQLHKITAKGGVLVVEVPNDFSKVQLLARDKGLIDRDFWVVSPDHISYFNKQGLCNLAAAADWNFLNALSDFPIDWFLFNQHSNYIQNKSLGKQSHYARVELDNLMHSISIEKTNRLYEALADLELGRQIIAFFIK